MKIIIILALINLSFLSASSGKELFEKNCMSCHLTEKPTISQQKNMIAPPIMGVAKRVKFKYINKEDSINFIIDYSNKPDMSKSVFGERVFQKFNIMPSMKGIMTDEEFKKVAEYIYENFPWSSNEKTAAMNYFKDRNKAK